MKKYIKKTYALPDDYSLYMMKNYIRELKSQNGLLRQYARLAMVKIGEQAIDILALLAIHPQWIIRWEAVKTLSQMKNTITAPLLINALEDECENIRWIAVQGLIKLGKHGLISVLEALSSYKLNVFLRKGAHAVIKEISKRYPLTGINVLIASLEKTTDYFEIPINAKNVLNELVNEDHNIT